MNSRTQFWAGLAVAVITGIPGRWALFLDHNAELEPLRSALSVAMPVWMFALETLTGYGFCSWKRSANGRKSAVTKKQAERIAAKQAKKAMREGFRPLTPGEIREL